MGLILGIHKILLRFQQSNKPSIRLKSYINGERFYTCVESVAVSRNTFHTGVKSLMRKKKKKKKKKKKTRKERKKEKEN